MIIIHAIKSNGIIAPSELIPEDAKAVRINGDVYEVAETDEEAKSITPKYNFTIDPNGIDRSIPEA